MRPDKAELLRYILEHEPLEKTRAHFGLAAEELREIFEGKKKPQRELPLQTAAEPGKLLRARVYTDGASRGNPGMAGAGAAILDAETGKVVELLKRYLGKQTNNVAEYQAAILGLTRARELGVREVELVADSQLLIRQLGGQYQVKHPGIRPLYDEAVALLKTFAKVKLIHVPREMNKLADEMSNRAIDER